MVKFIKRLWAKWKESAPPRTRRVAAAIMGSTVLLIGIALIFLPGPAFLVIPLGLAILASEFVWARHLMQRAQKLVKKGKAKWKRKHAAA